LAAYALLLAFGEGGYREFMAKPTLTPDRSRVVSKLEVVSATFLHFIVVQVFALVFAVIAKLHVLVGMQLDASAVGIKHAFTASWWIALHIAFSAIAFLGFALSLTTALAAGLAIFANSRWYVAYVLRKAEPRPSRPKRIVRIVRIKRDSNALKP
jgi:hypothetical protein